MKKGIHPEYHHDAKIICACGAVYDVGSTKKSQRIEVCSACHPFYTGQRRIVDTGGRVERFIKKYNWGAEPGTAPTGPKFKKGTEEVQEILKELEAASPADETETPATKGKAKAPSKAAGKAAGKAEGKTPATGAPAAKGPAKKKA